MMAIFAFGAMSAASASAKTIVANSGTLEVLTGEETGSGLNRLTAFGSRVECPGSTYTGTVEGATATVTPEYVNCKATALGFPVTVDMNGCGYDLHLGSTVSENTYGVQATLNCPGTGPQVTIFKFGVKPAEHTEANTKCILEVHPEAGGYSGLHLTDTTNGHVDLTGEATSIIVTQHEGPAGGCLPGGTEDANGKLDVDVTIDGDNTDEETVGVSVDET